MTQTASHGAPRGAVVAHPGPALRRVAAGGAPSAPCFPPKAGKHGGRTAQSPPAGNPAQGAPHGALHGAAHGAVWDAAAVIARLEDAGQSLLTLPGGSPAPRLRTAVLDVVRDPDDAYGWHAGPIRPAAPDRAAIGRMDEAFGWLALIPQDRYVLRRIAACRALVSPVSLRHLYSWRRLGTVLGADHKAVQRWHGQAIALIVAGLNAHRAAA